jgi:hypothetical protein
MKYNKSLLFLIISFLILSNAEVFAMESTAQSTYFSTITQWVSNLFIKNKIDYDPDKLPCSVREFLNKPVQIKKAPHIIEGHDLIPTKNNMLILHPEISIPSNESVVNEKQRILLTKIQDLKINDNVIEDDKFIEEVNASAELWKELSSLYVHNTFERCFNWSAPSFKDLSKLKRKLALLCHTDKRNGTTHAAEFTELFKKLALEERKNPLKRLFDAETITNIGDSISAKIDKHGNKIMKLKNSLLNDTIAIELNNAKMIMECDSYIEQNKNLQYLYQMKKGK